jgi:hypothetical protein
VTTVRLRSVNLSAAGVFVANHKPSHHRWCSQIVLLGVTIVDQEKINVKLGEFRSLDVLPRPRFQAGPPADPQLDMSR